MSEYLGSKKEVAIPEASMPSQQYYLLLADRDSTTKVLTERMAASKTAKALLWYKSTISQNLTHHFSPVFKLYLRTEIRTEMNKDRYADEFVDAVSTPVFLTVYIVFLKILN